MLKYRYIYGNEEASNQTLEREPIWISGLQLEYIFLHCHITILRQVILDGQNVQKTSGLWGAECHSN